MFQIITHMCYLWGKTVRLADIWLSAMVMAPQPGLADAPRLQRSKCLLYVGAVFA